ncbi:stage VI sporulation protein F [Peribacillus acanthi]|uniref:stage VI sporulation protein F n=1 Tax=Peribacillus acanthi TaxID=2171554 RepID=UPI000D3E9D8F|nr:stage VI sporulation protein F [Peribacillus acanthi]
MDSNFFKNMEKKTGVNMGDILNLANSLQGANLRDETTIRNLIKQVSKMANKPVNQEMEDKIVQSIVADGKSIDFSTIANMINNKK